MATSGGGPPRRRDSQFGAAGGGIRCIMSMSRTEITPEMITAGKAPEAG